MSKQNFHFGRATMTYRATNFGAISAHVLICGMITRLEIRACGVLAWLCSVLTRSPGVSCLLASFIHFFIISVISH